MQSSILYQDDSGAVVLVDLLRTIEEGQVPTGHAPIRCLIVDRPPPSAPFPSGQSSFTSETPSSRVRNLMMVEAAQRALADIRVSYTGVWTLPRDYRDRNNPSHLSTSAAAAEASKREQQHNKIHFHLPLNAHYICGSIESTVDEFLRLTSTCQFDLMVLDPPWPNRSAQRNGKRRGQQHYTTAHGLDETKLLLRAIPVPVKLAPLGLIAVWTTNSPGVFDLLTSPNPQDGLFASWGMEVVSEWTWLKVTTEGDTLYPVDADSRRKPWERLLIAGRRGQRNHNFPKNKCIVAVPDIHSRKPNLRQFFDPVFGNGYAGLEIFARNLTAGWWSWGDEVLKFQHSEHWADK